MRAGKLQKCFALLAAAIPVLLFAEANWLTEALSLIQTGNTSAARDLAVKAAARQPADPMPAVVLGTIDLQTENYVAAERKLLSALTLDPGLPGARLSLAAAYVGQRKFDQARDAYQFVLKRHPENATAILGLLNLPAAGRPPGELDKLCDRFLSMRPADVPALMRCARVANLNGNPEKALSILLQANKTSPREFRVLYALGVVCLQMDLVKDAIRNLEQAVALEPDNFRAIYALGSARIAQGDWDAALAAYERLLAVRPDDPLIQYAAGAVFYLRGKTEDAEIRLRRSQELDPSQVEPLFYLGLIAGKRGNSKESLRLFGEVPRRAPDHARAHVALGRVYQSMGNLEGAQQEFEAALRARHKTTISSSARPRL